MEQIYTRSKFSLLTLSEQPGVELTPEIEQTSRGFKKKYQTEFKLKVVISFLGGDGAAKLLAQQWSVPEEKIRTCVSHDRRFFRNHLDQKIDLRHRLAVLTIHNDPRLPGSMRVGGVFMEVDPIPLRVTLLPAPSIGAHGQ